VEGDPLSAEAAIDNTCTSRRGEWSIRIESSGRMTCTETHFLVTSRLEVHERNSRVFACTWTHEFPRDHC
jgi:hypothetical protein